MPRLPAACTECEIVYPSPLRADRPDGDNAFAVPAPCPDCGSGGRVPAEVLQRLTGAVEVLRGLEMEAAELEAALSDAAELCRAADSREDAVLDVLGQVPRIGRLAGLLPGETPARMAVFTRVVAALAEELRRGPAAGSADGADEGDTAAEEGAPEEPALEVVSRALEGLYERRVPAETGPPDKEDEVEVARRRLRETGRNDPCPCGSGEKYKACHWVEDQRTTRV